MRRVSHISKADRTRDEAIVESNRWDEGFPGRLHVHPAPVTNTHIEPAPIPDNEHRLRRPTIVAHSLVADAPNLVMADAFPAWDSATVAHTNAIATGSTASSAVSSSITEARDNASDRSESEIDLGVVPTVYDSSRPLFPEGPFGAVPTSTLDLGIHPSFDAEDHELNMSDEEHGGAPLVNDMDDEESVASLPELDAQNLATSDPFDSTEEEADSEAEDDQPNVFIPISFEYFPLGGHPVANGAGHGTNHLQMMMEPPLISNPNPTMLGSENLPLFDFLRDWALRRRPWRYEGPLIAGPPLIRSVHEQDNNAIEEVRYSDLQGDACDMQGLDWAAMNTTRNIARHYRSGSYQNYTNKDTSDELPTDSGALLPTTDSFFRFKGLIIRRDVHLAHFQLRSVLACPSRTKAFYPGFRAVNNINVDSKSTDIAVNLKNVHGIGSVISTLDANHGILMAGMFNGEYCLKNLDSEDPKQYTSGRVINNPLAITNHLQIHLPRRSSVPVAAVSNNDNGFRVVDLGTQKVLSQTMYDYSLNCSAVSPDGRLRILVGDRLDVTVIDTDTGEIQRELSGHLDFGFSCDWCDDGWMVATGNQDKTVKIWDARKWCDSNGKASPLKTIRTQLAGARSLRFSPAGSGPRVLVAAEEADYINIIDAQTFESQQSIDIFGEIGGVGFTNEGQDLNVLCCDHSRGGLLQLERLGTGPEPFLRSYDWRRELDDERRLVEHYRRRPALLDELHHF